MCGLSKVVMTAMNSLPDLDAEIPFDWILEKVTDGVVWWTL